MGRADRNDFERPGSERIINAAVPRTLEIGLKGRQSLGDHFLDVHYSQFQSSKTGSSGQNVTSHRSNLLTWNSRPERPF
jgi:hypothetical protein